MLFRISARRHAQVSPSRLIAAVLLGCIAGTAFLAGGCSDGQQETTRVEAPVLWASEDPPFASGIEPAEVSATLGGTPGSTVDLRDIDAKGVGPQWRAATASAAAIASLSTGRVRDRLSYSVTGPIDGPSGGAALTVASMAALRGQKLRPDITMTGTIAPDGSIGIVGLIPSKIRAAKEAGFKKILIPAGSFPETDPKTDEEVDPVAFARSQGLTAKRVETIDQAYEEFTGTSLTPTTAGPPSLPPSTRRVTQRITRRLVSWVTRRSSADSDSITRGLVASARQALRRSEYASAYGTAVYASYLLQRERWSSRMRSVLEREGRRTARRVLSNQVESLQKLAVVQMDRLSKTAGLSDEQQVTLPFALGWVAYCQAILDSYQVDERALWEQGPANLKLAAGILGEIDISLRRLAPDAVAVVRAGGASAAKAQTASSFLPGYTAFVSQSTRAQWEYFQAVTVLTALDTEGPGDPVPYAAAAVKWTKQKPHDAIDSQQQVELAARATTAYLLAETVISGPGFGLEGFGIGAVPGSATEPELLATSLLSALRETRTSSSALQQKGFNMGYPVWVSDWASRLARDGAPTRTAGQLTSITELWSTAMASSAVSSLTTSR